MRADVKVSALNKCQLLALLSWEELRPVVWRRLWCVVAGAGVAGRMDQTSRCPKGLPQRSLACCGLTSLRRENEENFGWYVKGRLREKTSTEGEDQKDWLDPMEVW